jgi:hypothetical protein
MDSNVGGALLTFAGVVAAVLAWVLPDVKPKVRRLLGGLCLLIAGFGVFLYLRPEDSKTSTFAEELVGVTDIPTSTATIAVPHAGRGAEVRACMAQHKMTRARTTIRTVAESRSGTRGAGPDEVTTYQSATGHHQLGLTPTATAR